MTSGTDSAIEIDHFDVELEVIEYSEELSEHGTGGVAVGKTAHPQGVSLVVHTCVECSVGVEYGRSCFSLAVVEAVCLLFVTVVGSQVEVGYDLHLMRECFENILLEKRVAGLFDGFLLSGFDELLTACRREPPSHQVLDEEFIGNRFGN